MNLNPEGESGQWAIVELMGHKVVAGLCSKSEMLGAPMLRIDVPATSIYPEFTQFYGEGSIYCVTFVSEQVARLTAEQSKINPVSVYVPELVSKEQHQEVVRRYEERLDQLRRSLPAPHDGQDEDPDEDEDPYGRRR